MATSRELWQQAQDRVADAFKLFESTRKNFVWKPNTDTYAARGNIVQAQHSDFWFLYRGVFVTLEVKSSHYEDKFYFKEVRPSQFAATIRIPAAGGLSAFVLAKLPQWDWYIADGRNLIKRKLAGDAGMRWSEMIPLRQLTVEEMLGKLQIFYGERLFELLTTRC